MNGVRPDIFNGNSDRRATGLRRCVYGKGAAEGKYVIPNKAVQTTLGVVNASM